MILVQLSSGAGPLECCKAVAMVVKRLECDAKALAIKVNTLAVEQAELSGCYKSVLLELTGAEPQILKQFAQQWHGSMLWVCQSPFRARHKRKNWYFGGQIFEIAEQTFDSEIRFQQCRASGAGAGGNRGFGPGPRLAGGRAPRRLSPGGHRSSSLATISSALGPAHGGPTV